MVSLSNLLIDLLIVCCLTSSDKYFLHYQDDKHIEGLLAVIFNF
jgi:hypothetical protein